MSRTRNKERFSPLKHVPQYTKNLLVTLGTPLLVYFALIGNFILLILIFAFWHYEGGVNPKVGHFWDALWWGMVTVTTVGYGDITPITMPGKIIAILLMISGVIFFVSFTALLVSFLISHTSEISEPDFADELSQIKAELKSIKSLLKSKN